MNKRQVQIVKTLYRAQGYLTVGELAQQMGVSDKTVRNDIGAVREFLADRQMGDVESRPHHGVRLQMLPQQWEAFLKDAAADIANAQDAEIEFFILFHLLKEGSLTAQHLSQQYFITRTQLDRILDQVENWFFKNHIVFERRRGKGISIQYSEFNYRLAVVNFYSQYKDLLCKGSPGRESRFSSIGVRDYTAACTLLGGFDVDDTIQVVSAVESEFSLRFSYTSGVGLLLLCSLSVLRTRGWHLADTPKPPPCRTEGESDGWLTASLVRGLQAQFHMSLPMQEQEFLRFAVAVSEVQGFDSEAARRSFELANVEACRLTIKFVNLASEITGVALHDDKFFVTQTFLLLKAMVARLNYQTGFKNPLLGQIKAKYPNMMAVAWSAGNIFETELGLDLNEHEAGFLALLIGGAIERSSLGISACIVCDYGVGISQILREKIERAVPDLLITAVYSNRDIRRIKSENCDFIISTIPLDGIRVNKPIVVVGHLLDGADTEAITAQIKCVRTVKRESRAAKTLRPAQGLFTGELLFPKVTAADKRELIQMLCTRLEALGYVSPGFIGSVLDREAHTSTEVGKGIALPHGYSRYVNRSVVAFASLAEPIAWFDGDDEVDLIFLLAFDLDEAKGRTDDIIKFYKSFVGFMEDDAVGARLRSLTQPIQILKIFENW